MHQPVEDGVGERGIVEDQELSLGKGLHEFRIAPVSPSEVELGE